MVFGSGHVECEYDQTSLHAKTSFLQISFGISSRTELSEQYFTLLNATDPKQMLLLIQYKLLLIWNTCDLTRNQQTIFSIFSVCSSILYFGQLLAAFHFGRLPFWLSSILVDFHFGCLPFYLPSILVVFRFGHLPFWSSSILAILG